MVIEFMAARYKRNDADTDWIMEKCSTVSVTINSTVVQDKIGLNPIRAGTPPKPLFNEKARLVCDTVYDEEGSPPNKYCKSNGIILFQEHDTYVQFREIQIDPKWLPSSGGGFNKTWQKWGSTTNKVRGVRSGV